MCSKFVPLNSGKFVELGAQDEWEEWNWRRLKCNYELEGRAQDGDGDGLG